MSEDFIIVVSFAVDSKSVVGLALKFGLVGFSFVGIAYSGLMEDDARLSEVSSFPIISVFVVVVVVVVVVDLPSSKSLFSSFNKFEE